MRNYVLIFLFYSLFSLINSSDLFLRRLTKSVHEIEAMNIIKQSIYMQEKINTTEPLELMYKRNWIKASRLIVDFLLDHKNSETTESVKSMLENMQKYLQDLKDLLKDKKKNIVKISPLFQWSQDEKWVKIRIRFARNIDSPGEKDIEKFQVNVTHSNLIVNGYKNHEDYLVWYHRDMITFDNIKTYSLEYYKETDGAYIVKFLKLQPTMYWSFLDTTGGSHEKIITWMDMFEKFEERKQYFEKVTEINDNLLHRDLQDTKNRKVSEKNKRINRINKIDQFLRNKDLNNKNFCNSPVNMNFCIIPKPDEWAYWLL